MSEKGFTPQDRADADLNKDNQLDTDELKVAAETELATGDVEGYYEAKDELSRREQAEAEAQALLDAQKAQQDVDAENDRIESEEEAARVRDSLGQDPVPDEQAQEKKKREWKGSLGDYAAAGAVGTAAGTGWAMGKAAKGAKKAAGGIFGFFSSRFNRFWNADWMKKQRKEFGWLGGGMWDNTVGLIKRDAGKPEFEHEGIQEAKKKASQENKKKKAA